MGKGGMRVLVIGGTRFIGPPAIRQIVAQGHDVAVFHRGVSSNGLPASVRHFTAPEAAYPVRAIPSILPDWGPDIVLHMVPLGEADAVCAVTAFRGIAKRIVGISSGDVYRAYGRFTGLEPGPIEPMPLSEEAPLR